MATLTDFREHAPDRRLAGLGVTILIHAALILCWQVARTLPPAQVDGIGSALQWIALPALPRHAQTAPPAARLAAPLPVASRLAPRASATAVTPAAAASAPAPAPASTSTPVFSAPTPAAPSAATILDNARNTVGAIDRALRQENRPYLIAPPDSPEIRMRRGMERAHAMAPPKLWEAPKIEELVNQTGDGARRERVITANGTYCITERSPATSIDMIETLGKRRLTSCPQHEATATQQDWRTARD